MITAVKAKEFIARNTGKRGVVVLSFRTPKDKNDEVEMVRIGGVQIVPAYGSRSNRNPHHRIRTHISWGQRGRWISCNLVFNLVNRAPVP